mmetsp:Transcript_57275/g.121770  ORF Transcript_57275/g.121770 Transcript_57275/m.121770 type:complete len:826 (-) Transcript_57275:93-2570(-)
MAGDSNKHTGDLYKQVLANQLEERVARVKTLVDNGKAVTRSELAKFVWGTTRRIFDLINPELNAERKKTWLEAMGMLKGVVDWPKWDSKAFSDDCVQHVLEDKVLHIFDSYRTFVLTGEVATKHPPPKLLGETDEILCVDKPCLYTCTYGGDRGGGIPPLGLKHMGAKASASLLLNGENPSIQLHEYLALKYNFENARLTREFWAQVNSQELSKAPCTCGYCDVCATTQTGCCNRLDKETSGVMICAKTPLGFVELRQQFQSEHSLEEGGTEKYYLCLVHGEVIIPEKDDDRNPHWKHTRVKERGRIEVAVHFDQKQWKALPFDDRVWENGQKPPKDPSDWEWKNRQKALTFYRPVAYFEYGAKKEVFTLCHVQIITGRTHQIRFHMQQVGHVLVGDTTYGAPTSDRGWCPRVYLHSYHTRFREPFTDRWFEATSPLPQDLGEVLETNFGPPVKVVSEVFKSRRLHEKLQACLVQYDPSKALLVSHDGPIDKQTVMLKVNAAKAAMEQRRLKGGKGPVWTNTEGVKKSNSKEDVSGNDKWKKNDWNSNNNNNNKDGWKSGQNNWDSKDNKSWGQKRSREWEDDKGNTNNNNSNNSNNSNSNNGNNKWNKGSWNDSNGDSNNDKWDTSKQNNGWGSSKWGSGDWKKDEDSKGDVKDDTKDEVKVELKEEAKEEIKTETKVEHREENTEEDDDWSAWTSAAATEAQTEQPQLKKARLDPLTQKYSEARVALSPPQPLGELSPPPPAAAPAQSSMENAASSAAVAASLWKRQESRSCPGLFYYWNTKTKETAEEPPAPWVKKTSRSDASIVYYWNPLTGATSSQKPEL